MISHPRFVLTLAGLGLVALPLVHLTCQPQSQPGDNIPQAAPQSIDLRTHLTLRFTGKPTSIILKYEDTEWLHTRDASLSPIELEVNLPQNVKYADVEAEIHWAADSSENAVTLTLEPSGLPTRTETQWTGSNGEMLHTIFSFSW